MKYQRQQQIFHTHATTTPGVFVTRGLDSDVPPSAFRLRPDSALRATSGFGGTSRPDPALPATSGYGVPIGSRPTSSSPRARPGHLRQGYGALCVHYFPGHSQEFVEAERLGEPAATALGEEAFGFGANHVAGNEHDVVGHLGVGFAQGAK